MADIPAQEEKAGKPKEKPVKAGKPEKSPQEKPAVRATGSIMRVVETNLDGGRPVRIAIRSIKARSQTMTARVLTIFINTRASCQSRRWRRPNTIIGLKSAISIIDTRIIHNRNASRIVSKDKMNLHHHNSKCT